MAKKKSCSDGKNWWLSPWNSWPNTLEPVTTTMMQCSTRHTTGHWQDGQLSEIAEKTTKPNEGFNLRQFFEQQLVLQISILVCGNLGEAGQSNSGFLSWSAQASGLTSEKSSHNQLLVEFFFHSGSCYSCSCKQRPFKCPSCTIQVLQKGGRELLVGEFRYTRCAADSRGCDLVGSGHLFIASSVSRFRPSHSAFGFQGPKLAVTGQLLFFPQSSSWWSW